jgi:hypothetical protein
VLRHIHDGKIQGTSVGFTVGSADRSSDCVSSHGLNVVSKVNLGSKLLAHTCDGASVMSGHLNRLQHKVLEAYPRALNVHCRAHVLRSALSQSLKNIEECILFFSLNGIATFTSHSTKTIYALTEYLKRKIFSLAVTRWPFSNCLLSVIEAHEIFILEHF